MKGSILLLCASSQKLTVHPYYGTPSRRCPNLACRTVLGDHHCGAARWTDVKINRTRASRKTAERAENPYKLPSLVTAKPAAERDEKRPTGAAGSWGCTALPWDARRCHPPSAPRAGTSPKP
eukprot:scaffold12888_cov144-Isochrysis_galbana.AAC.3